MPVPELILYVSTYCSSCMKVTGYLKKRGIPLPLRNVSGEARFREELVRIGGKSQVPCLVIDGKALYESDDIIRWLQENWKSP